MATQPDQTPYETPGSHVHHVHVLRLRSLKKMGIYFYLFKKLLKMDGFK